ncbi:hypothetical protein SAMN05518871_11137 [Psychrobacillus sp. OK028]|uniref:hypothetical protein n=1 Tax=Psychrobacillus sp. OK028 TaxID=1884359 RepID=UPI000888CC3C|nr:hypothetical protein [Psychrobacillus sp. OK028]SDO15438.1 hypothetical protein SAMN05518871_11137 [Psychrobacillus sp. OK028]
MGNFMGTGNWLGIFSTVLIIMCFYFTLTFFQYLKQDDARLTKQSKFGAVICLAASLLIPTLYNLYMFNEMMK